MENVLFLVKILGGVIGIGTVAGVLIGKYLVKRANSKRAPVLTTRERIIYGSSILIGVAVILVGIFFQFPETVTPGAEGDSIVISDEANPGGGTVVGGVSPRRAVIRRSAPRAATAVAVRVTG